MSLFYRVYSNAMNILPSDFFVGSTLAEVLSAHGLLGVGLRKLALIPV